MSMGEIWTGLVALTVAAATGIYRLSRDRRKDRQTEMDTVRAQALAQARLEALEREARAAVEQKNAELTLKDQVIADLSRRNEQLRGIVADLSKGRAS